MAPANPYIFDKPLDSDTGFFGRAEILSEVEQNLRYPPHTSAILHGQRRMGKTSLLLALDRHLPQPPFFPIYFDLSGKEMLTVGEVLHQIASTAAKKAEISPPDAADFKDNPAAFHETFLPELYQALGSERQPIFLLDEFKPLPTSERDLPKDAAVRGLDVYLYGLLTSQSYTDFIFTAGRRMQEMSDVFESSFEADFIRVVPILGREPAKDLILQEDVKGLPKYEDEAVEKILDLTRGHPYLTQLICYHLYEKAYERSKRKPKVTAQDVDDIIPGLLEPEASAIPLIWDSIPPAEKVILSVIAARATNADDVLNNAVIGAALTEAGISPESAGLNEAKVNLVNWQVLEQGGNSYNFYSDFFRLWVAHNRPLDQVKQDEFGHLDPTAEALYKAAVVDYENDHPQEAIDKLYQTLDINPRHVPARILLAQILKEQDQLTNAVVQYEEAYKEEPDTVLAPLIATLLLLGIAMAALLNWADAVAAYKRILKLDPDNGKAKANLADAQRNLAEQKRKTAAKRPKEEKEQRRLHPVWLLLLLLLLLLLCPLLWWLYNQPDQGGQQSIAAQTAAANKVATRTAATIAAATNDSQQGTASANNAETEALAVTQTAQALNATAEADIAEKSATATVAAQTQLTATAEATIESSEQLQVVGSDSMQPLMEDLAQAFTNENPDVQVVIQSEGSKEGLAAVKDGQADISTVGRDLSPEEQAQIDAGDLQVLPVAENDPVVMVSHPTVSVDDLSSQQVRDIYAGNITNWSEVGGPDVPIVVISSAEGSDTRTVFEQSVLGEPGLIAHSGVASEEPTDQAVQSAVANTPYAIGFTSQQSANPSQERPDYSEEAWGVIDSGFLETKTLSLDGASPSPENTTNGSYPATRPLNVITNNKPNETTKRWIDFMNSPAGQEAIQQAGHAPVQ